MVNVTEYLLKTLKLFLNNKTAKTREITLVSGREACSVKNRKLAEQFLIKQVQITIAKEDKKKYYLEQDSRGIYRMQSRIIKTRLPVSDPNPIFLPKKQDISELIVFDIHLRNFHSGSTQTLAELRRKYWVPQGRRAVREIIGRRCMLCRR